MVIILFSIQAWGRIGAWKDDNTIVADIIAHNPDVYYGYWMRGNLEKADLATCRMLCRTIPKQSF